SPHAPPRFFEEAFMRRLVALSALILLLLVPASARATVGPATDFVAHLNGGEEVPARATRARGQFVAQLSEDGSSIAYKLIVADLGNLVVSHSHRGDAGSNGPVVVFLAGPFPAGGGRVDGVVAEGTFTSADLVGPLAGTDLAVLVEALRNGGAYVNAHTNDGNTTPNEGP